MSERSSPSPAHLTNALFYFSVLLTVYCITFIYFYLCTCYILYFNYSYFLYIILNCFWLYCNAALLWQYECTNICHANKAPKLWNRVCVCVCECELRERERESDWLTEWVSVSVRERERECVCVCALVYATLRGPNVPLSIVKPEIFGHCVGSGLWSPRGK